MKKANIPELSLKQYTHGSENERLDFSAQLFAALKEFGFAIIKDHLIE